jgi:hypothetical protein
MALCSLLASVEEGVFSEFLAQTGARPQNLCFEIFIWKLLTSLQLRLQRLNNAEFL